MPEDISTLCYASRNGFLDASFPQVPVCMQGLTAYAVPDSVMRCTGSAVVVERGGCTFVEKAQALSAAHAAAMIVYNTEEGQHPICLSSQLTHRPCMQAICSMPM